MNAVANDVVGEFVGFSKNGAAFDASAGHPEAVATRMMVSSEAFLGDVALAVSGAPKFAAPDNECFVQKSALFEVGD